jgi:hypothetical protein
VSTCADGASTTPAPIATFEPHLNRLPPKSDCAAELITFRWIRFAISTAVSDTVTAVTDDGHRLRTFWDNEFELVERSGELVVRDAAGGEVVRNGQSVEIHVPSTPRIQGHLVCLGTDRLWVFGNDPT